MAFCFTEISRKNSTLGYPGETKPLLIFSWTNENERNGMKWKKMNERDIQKQFQMPRLPGAQEENMEHPIGSAASPAHASHSGLGIPALCTSFVENLKLSLISHTWTALRWTAPILPLPSSHLVSITSLSGAERNVKKENKLKCRKHHVQFLICSHSYSTPKYHGNSFYFLKM